MIIVLELMDEGVAHAPGNSQWTQVIARAAPGQRVRLLAPATHLAALRGDANLLAQPNIELGEIPLIASHRRQVNVASLARFREELAILRAAIGAAPAGEPCLVVLASAAPTAAWAALLAGRLLGRRVAVQMVLHGFANEVEGWRSRNPLGRRFDLRGFMERTPRRVRFLALERSIAAELGRIVPAAAARIDVLPLPVNADEAPLAEAVPLSLPLQVALVGQTTAAKGIGPFLETARALKARHGGAVAFHVIGRRFPETDAAALAVLDSKVPEGFLDRAAFVARLRPIHQVFLPLSPRYYRLSASGALIDAITWLKPVIAADIPICRDAFADGGDIGVLCDDLAAMQAALERLVTAPDHARHARQIENLRALRARRMPEALVGVYADILRVHFQDIVRA